VTENSTADSSEELNLVVLLLEDLKKSLFLPESTAEIPINLKKKLSLKSPTLTGMLSMKI